MRKASPDEHKVKFKTRPSGGLATLFKSEDDDRFVIWGKASVEVVDKEGDKITGDALKEALPQLLRRSRLSVEHTDQLVGDILESFETEEPVTVEIDGKEYTRSEFPTGVLKMDGEEAALFVAGEVWNDTQQARKTRELIEDGEYDSYSISGEAITSSTQVKNGDVYDKITDMDLSAVTLCEEGMNQKAKFGTVVKMGSDDPTAAGDMASSSAAVAKDDSPDENMTNENNPDDPGNDEGDLRKQFKEAAQEALDESDFATKEEVEELIDEKVDERFEAADDGMTSEEGGEATYGGGDDEDEEEKSEEEKSEEEKSEEEKEAEETEEKSEVEQKAEEMAEKYGVDAEKARELLEDKVDPDEIEDPDDDEEEELDIDPTEDEEMPPEEGDPEEGLPDEEEAEKGDLISQLEAEGVPDDLCEAVEGYVDGEEGMEPDEPEEPVEPDEGDEVELEDDTAEKDEGDAVGGDDLGEDLSKMGDEEYLTATAGSSLPGLDDEEEIGKSYDAEVEKEDEDGTEGSALNALYEDIMDAEAP